MLKLVVDTNLFHEFRKLDDLPWLDLGENHDVLLIVTEVVLTELDKQKKSPRARIKRRAIEWTKQFRDMTLSRQESMVIQATSPSVILRLDSTSFGPDNYGNLDLTVPDDQLVATAKRIEDLNPNEPVTIFADDIRPLRKAQGIGLAIMAIPDQWRRQDEQTDDDKEREGVKQENMRLRSQEPILKLSMTTGNPIAIALNNYARLTSYEVTSLMNIVRQANPLETRFDRKRDKDPRWTSLDTAIRGLTQYQFRAVTEDEITRYKEGDFAAWEMACRSIFEDAHSLLSNLERKFIAEFSLVNSGTRPALDTLVTIRSKGDMLVEPASDVGPEMRWPLNRAVLNLPLAPIAPQGEWHTFSPFQSHLDELQRSLRNPTLPSMLDYPLVTSSLGRRDPNSFYYRKRPAHPVTEYSLNCAQYRHAGSEEVFICTCTLVGTGKKLDGSRALLECTVEASNLTDPVKLSISVKLTVKESSTYDLILGLLL